MRDFIDDGIQYAEIRPNFPSNALIKDDGSEFIDNFGLMAIIEEELEKFKKQEPSFGMKVIYCTPRSFTNEQVERSLNECIELKGRFRSLLCGMWEPDCCRKC
jgi:adenosine deaminase CECR1